MSEQDWGALWKACPCCGQPAKLLENHYGTIAEYWIRCPECGLGTTWYPTKDAAIAAWNMRVGCASCRDEAIGAALAVEQKCYDQAQELAALRARIELAQSIIQESYRDYLTEAQWNESKLDRLAQAIWGEPVQDDMEASHD